MNSVLIVEDEEPVRDVIKDLLEGEGYECLEAADGEEALSVLRSHDLDLVITDLVMPSKCGIDLIMELHDVRPRLPILAISGGGGISGRFDYLSIAKLVGADAILRKPFDLGDVKQKVKELVSARISLG